MPRTTGGTIYKVFGGKKYLLTRQFDSKIEAKEYAEWLRGRGYLVRIVKTNMAKKYHLYRRAKR